MYVFLLMVSRFINRVSGARHDHEPPSFYGGIIADPMGLGKTLAMITLVASDSYFMVQSEDSSFSGVLGEESCGLTLIVVPPALLGMWDEELMRHTEPRRLPWRLHHGKNRLRHISELANTTIVLTTYHTVSTEWRTEAARKSSMLFATRWRRVILDEAHFIRNRDSKMAKAVCALDSVSRWAVTGTPIQNHLNDLATLLKFLNAHPYNEKRVFDADISHMWKAGNAEEAVKRLKRLAGCLLLRRPRKTVELPPRRDLACHIELQPDERELCNQIRAQTISQIDQVLLQGSQKQGATSSFSVLQQIVGMSLTLTVASRAYLMEPSWNPTIEDQALARIHRMGQEKEVTTVRFYVKDSFEEVSRHHPL
ncbi:WD domain-containing protein [Colletotrichum kahawae]|uniref:WD domain-containing protein n=1 Tax=Colletotrichum kahawae TaxID=34407 RepID=A0AAD9XZT5_COLKA|nr:WD domain-containing protein [Colletotrichum kahawae]